MFNKICTFMSAILHILNKITAQNLHIDLNRILFGPNTESFLFCVRRSRLWNRHPEDDTDGEVSAVGDGTDRGPIQVCVSGCATSHPNAHPAYVGWTGDYDMCFFLQIVIHLSWRNGFVHINSAFRCTHCNPQLVGWRGFLPTLWVFVIICFISILICTRTI